MSAVPPLTDVQASPDAREIEIERVGVKEIRHPARIKDRNGGEQLTVARFNLYVGLPKQFKGTHMSRFLEILNQYEREISVRSFHEMLYEIAERLDSRTSHVEMSFPYFIDKRAPVSGARGLMDYEVGFIGELDNDRLTMRIRVVVPVTSLCPCSKEIADYGAHNQRSKVTVTARIRDFIWIEELIELVEAEASCDLYAILKRPDEKFVTERAYDRPRFVEDSVRDVAARLDRDPRIAAYVVESENYESIHNHSAYALVRRDKGLADE